LVTRHHQSIAAKIVAQKPLIRHLLDPYSPLQYLHKPRSRRIIGFNRPLWSIHSAASSRLLANWLLTTASALPDAGLLAASATTSLRYSDSTTASSIFSIVFFDVESVPKKTNQSRIICDVSALLMGCRITSKKKNGGLWPP
jgi:hypothetical protein